MPSFIHRTPDKLEYLAGVELAAGMFANDALLEEKAKLQEALNNPFL
jgi:UDPglucose--hexose-1-phosphate uridylyltransferase